MNEVHIQKIARWRRIGTAKSTDETPAGGVAWAENRDRVERSLPEFIARVQAGLLGDSGLKRHYKLPEAVKILRAKRNKV